MKATLLSCLFFFLLVSCKTSNSGSPELSGDSERMKVLKGELTYEDETIFDREVTIYPEAFLKTTGKGKLIFTKKVNILGESQVFDDNINIRFSAATINELNPCWFGAKGYDNLDDTKAFQKTLELAQEYTSSINIIIPIGKFKISQTLEVGNQKPNGKSINLLGKSMSSSSNDGSVLEWTGQKGRSQVVIKNYCVGRIEGLDFTSASPNLLKHNVDMRPYDYQVMIENCSFSGCAGPGSANVNINSGNNLQVSEIYFRNCLFRSYAPISNQWLTESAVMGGLANTKNFSFEFCSFIGYSVGAIHIEVSDIVRVENCTFAFNEIDIICLLCNSVISGNYSEQSNSFFKSTVSKNISFTTMMNNCFYGQGEKDYVIREGAGNLLLFNNNLGGFGGDDPVNKIRWDDGSMSSIHSIGNFFRNATKQINPFVNNQNDMRINRISSFGDMIGNDGLDIKEIMIKKP